MKKRFLTKIVVLAALVSGVCGVAGLGNVANVAADNAFNKEICNNNELDAIQKEAAGCNEERQVPSVANNLINVVISLAGIVAVIVLVFGGQRYLVANGDPGKLAAAKSMIMYGVIGLLVTALAFAVVNFVLKGLAS